MTIVVVGGGAIGLLVAGRLAQASQPVALLVRPKTSAALETQPLSIKQAGQTQKISTLIAKTEITELPLAYQNPQLAILCVKGYATAEALPTLLSLQPKTILTLQNGLGHEETLANVLGKEKIIAGVITSSVDVESSTSITVTKVGGIGLARLSDALKIAPIAAALGSGAFRIREYADYRALKWSKVLLNMLGNATAAILDLPVDAIYTDQRLVALEQRAFQEALAVMKKLHIQPVNLPGYPVIPLAFLMQKFPTKVVAWVLRGFAARGRGGKIPSLQHDLRQGKTHSEGEYLYGAIAQAGEQVGSATPINKALWQVLNNLVTGNMAKDTFRHKPDQLLEFIANYQC